MLTKYLIIIGSVLLILAIYSPLRHPIPHKYVLIENVHNELVFINKNSEYYYSYNIKNCSYQDLILNNHDIDTKTITDIRAFQKPKAGGEYVPTSCRALIKTAVIIPYRNRTRQLEIFLNYMHNYLQNQKIHYRIFVVEQRDSLPFNRAKMFNNGAHLAIKLKYDCLILHDVDLIPLSTGNIYGCSKRPRHMSSSIDVFRYILPYPTLTGGVGAILSEHYKLVNGMSNFFYGWGGEDDDFYRRLKENGLIPHRFAPELSKYSMLYHKNEKPSADRFTILYDKERDPSKDGLNSLIFNYKVQLKELYTHVLA